MAVRLSVCNERGRCVRVKFAMTSAGTNEAEVKTWEVTDLIDAIADADDILSESEEDYEEYRREVRRSYYDMGGI